MVFQILLDRVVVDQRVIDIQQKDHRIRRCHSKLRLPSTVAAGDNSTPEYNRPACQKVLVNKRAPVDLMLPRRRALPRSYSDSSFCAVSSGEGSEADRLTPKCNFLVRCRPR